MKGHEVADANFMASVGVDYLKVRGVLLLLLVLVVVWRRLP